MRKLILWLLRWLFPKKPSRLKSLIEVYDMSNVRLSWVLPTPSPRQRPIAAVRIEARVSADLPWTEIAVVQPPTTELIIQDAAPGDWFYRGIVVDEAGDESATANATAAVPFDGPSPLVEFTATLV